MRAKYPRTSKLPLQICLKNQRGKPPRKVWQLCHTRKAVGKKKHSQVEVLLLVCTVTKMENWPEMLNDIFGYSVSSAYNKTEMIER